jgi:hypothetical protein
MILGCWDFYPFREDSGFLRPMLPLMQVSPKLRDARQLPENLPPNEFGLLSRAPLPKKNPETTKRPHLPQQQQTDAGRQVAARWMVVARAPRVRERDTAPR